MINLTWEEKQRYDHALAVVRQFKQRDEQQRKVTPEEKRFDVIKSYYLKYATSGPTVDKALSLAINKIYNKKEQ